MKTNRLLFFFIVFTSFLGCKESTTFNPEPYFTIGEISTDAAFKSLSGTLKKQISANGPVEAVAYCHSNASPLLDSVSNHYKVKITRTSLKPRNLNNSPSKFERELLLEYEKQGPENLTARVEKEDGRVFYYRPITTKGLCLLCHGAVSDRPEALKQKIQNLYPDDQANNYLVGDLRGMWVVEFLEQ